MKLINVIIGVFAFVYFFLQTDTRKVDDTFFVNKYDDPSNSEVNLLPFENKHKVKRSAENDSSENLYVKVNGLNDMHAQLMVHWLRNGSDLMICLARDPPVEQNDDTKQVDQNPPKVFISFDYGDTFKDKTNLFKVTVNQTLISANLDQFLTDPKYDTIIFTDTRNKAIFNFAPKTEKVRSTMLDFTPSDISFYEKDPNVFLILDKKDIERKLYLTTDGGNTFRLLQERVKSFSWSSGAGAQLLLYIEREEFAGTSSIIYMDPSNFTTSNDRLNLEVLIENVNEFFIKKDFMFVTRKDRNTVELLISYRRAPFVKAYFQTELDIKGFHISDVEGKVLMISAAHSNTMAHLYVAEFDEGQKLITFVKSLDNIFTFIPNVLWKTGWIIQTTDEPFSDLYKVEGMEGIYIASKIHKLSESSISEPSVGPEHLVSVITFDHGHTWQPITAPTVDDEGKSIDCAQDCSLHLSQKFSQLYPVTRSISIMSSKLAPGIIMASGVVGGSLKGHPGVFLSKDAGLTWKQVLKGYHFFNFGDHGGILVAVRYFKSKGETRKILYSTDEGDNWQTYSFHSKDLKVYGLMTEPNSNSTIFTLFGSEKEEHRWIIVKIDFQKAFARNCTEADYKFWTPKSTSTDGEMWCTLGKQLLLQKRIAHTNCLNGKDYKRINTTSVCPCSKRDFECDYGFIRQSSNNACILDKQITQMVNPYGIPSTCSPGKLYNRTRGYKKLEGDQCVGGIAKRYLPQTLPCPFEESSYFLLVAQREYISRVNLNNFSVEKLPINDLKNVISLDFDMKNNCVFFADIFSDKIVRQCLNGVSAPEIISEDNLASVEGMSYDWVSELLFFVDGTRAKIEAIKTSNDSLFQKRTTILESPVLIKPRGIVVHPLEGYLFWTDWGSSSPSLSRSNLDGTNVKQLFTKPAVIWPNGVTIDYFAQRIYWVDAADDYIGSSDLDGKHFSKVLHHDSRIAHPFAIAVFKDKMYWDDWKMRSIFSADKDHGIMIETVATDLSHLMDLKVFAHSLQHGTNQCVKHNCSHICVGLPNEKYACLCPDGYVMSNKSNDCICANGSNNSTCQLNLKKCGKGYFACKTSGQCIPQLYTCDGENDCVDLSDEENCSPKGEGLEITCLPNMHICESDGKCISEYKVCDFENDCADGSDEKNCTIHECSSREFRCKSGHCIMNQWVCDGDKDCSDGSDEIDCKHMTNETTPHESTCKLDEFQCRSNGECIPLQWRCDIDYDCPDTSDEFDCQNKVCDSMQFRCNNGKCISKTWVCDGDVDCEAGEDENNCTETENTMTSTNFPSIICHDWMFQCTNDSKCIPMWWKCDGVNDCGDNSDEFGCNNRKNVITTYETPNQKDLQESKCAFNEFECNSGNCIYKVYVCDGSNDCSEGEDEEHCIEHPTEICQENEFRCTTDKKCLPISKYCDKFVDCSDGSDEKGCDTLNTTVNAQSITCEMGYFVCDELCEPLYKRCDKKRDCFDDSDEKNCNNITRVLQITKHKIQPEDVTETSIKMSWSRPLHYAPNIEYLPSISESKVKNWRNASKWTENSYHEFMNLMPYTEYNITVYVRTNDYIHPPYLQSSARTLEGTPTEPINFKKLLLNSTHIKLGWNKPKYMNGELESYNVYYKFKDNTRRELAVKVENLTAVINIRNWSNGTYQFWVTAKNNRKESRSSNLLGVVLNPLRFKAELRNLSYTISDDNTTISLKWESEPYIQSYMVWTILPEQYPNLPSNKTNTTGITFKNLARGIVYTFKVSSLSGNEVGNPKSIRVYLKGDPLPELTNIHVLNNFIDHTASVEWDKVNMSTSNVTYGIYYGTTLQEYLEKPRAITQYTRHYFRIKPCLSYLIGANIIGPYGPGPLPKKPLTLETPDDYENPPRNLNARMSSTERRTLIINWDHSCPYITTYPPYLLSIYEQKQNRTYHIEVKSKRDRTMSHYIVDIPYAAVFNISVKRNLDESQYASIAFNATKLESPKQLQVLQENENSFLVFWKKIVPPPELQFKYQVVIYEGILSNYSSPDEAPVVKIIDADAPPLSVSKSDLGIEDTVGKVFTFGIRIMSSDGYSSDIRDTENVEFISSSKWYKQVSSSSYIWLLPVCLIVSIIFIASLYYITKRNKRERASFTRFANSHYDPKTGATRIEDGGINDVNTSNNYDHNRFSDDDPLVQT